MGWWKVENSDNLVGDGPLDTLGEAVEQVAAEYMAAHGRRPTRGEWEALLLAVLASEDSDEQRCADGSIRRVSIELK
jgi:hypothetical protein